MESIRIDTGIIRLAINDDETRVISFSPQDVCFAERFYSLLSAFEAKETEYRQKSAEIANNVSVGAFGIPNSTGPALALLHETNDFLRSKIDYVFGEGTSEKAFGSAITLDMFEQFFNGITPYVQKARSNQVQKYTKKSKPGVMK